MSSFIYGEGLVFCEWCAHDLLAGVMGRKLPTISDGLDEVSIIQ